MNSGLVINMGRVTFDNSEVEATILPYQSKDQLKQLRIDHEGRWVFRRHGGTEIVCVPVVEAPSVLPGSSRVIRLSEDLGLAASLVRHTLIKYLYDLGREIIDYEPVSFVAGGASENLLAACASQGATCPEWLSVRPLYEMDVRAIYPDRQDPFVALVVNVRTIRLIKGNCSELVAAGLSPVGLYVGRHVQRGGPKISPAVRLAGRVTSVVGQDLQLTDCRAGEPSNLPMDKAFLDPNRETFDTCVRHVFGGQSAAVQGVLAEKTASVVNGPARLERLRKAVGHLGSLAFDVMPGVPFKIHPFLEHGKDRSFPAAQKAPRPVFVFDPTGTNTDEIKPRGLDTYGPYSSKNFTPTRPRICVVCQSAHKGRVEVFLHKFFHGVPGKPGTKAPFAKGLIRQYAFEDVSTEFFTTADGSADAYSRAARAAIEWQTQNDTKWNLALVEVEESTHSLPNAANPYLITKTAFHSHQIPVQEFEKETMELSDYQLGYALSNMALATYAKLQGIPWLMKATPTIAHELVFGLGSANVGQGRLGDRERVVGITTVFTGDGNYWLSNLSQAVPMDGYQVALLNSLRATVERVSRDLNWQKREHVRLIFHAFKPFRDAEADAVKNVVASMGDYDVEYAFVHVVGDHPYLVFDTAQQGVQDWKTHRSKGVFAPPRGMFFRLSDRETLITLTGPNEVKRPEDGLPRPILLRIHKESTFKDTTYLARQVYAFSDHSWRSFLPAHMPVTIMYSQLIADLLGRLSILPRWNPDVMAGKIGRTRWFL